MIRLRSLLVLLTFAAIGFVVESQPTLWAEAPRALPAGKLPDDVRLKPLKTLDGYFPMEVSKSPADWEIRAAALRRQMRVALGIWPEPTRTPLNAVVHGKIEKEDYTVEKAFFESMPGYFVTGNLYRPKGKEGMFAGVICPHGHWNDGRFYDDGTASLKKKLEDGGELFEQGGRSPLQARCVQLARMGCVVFHYDMIGYADATQLSFELAHRFGVQREEANDETSWGLYSPQAEARAQSIMGLQTWNAIRALDFITSLNDVDPDRIGVTGASGGGTQTMILGALDPRPAAAFPAVMVSTAMQGGCTCENASLLRVGDAGNIHFAALFAPKPIGMTSADDWTKELETKGFPELRQHFNMMGAPNHVMLAANTQFKHNYNAVSRAAMYDWFNKHLKLNVKEPIKERDYDLLTKAEMTVWNDKHPEPEGGFDFERKLLQWWQTDADQQLAKLIPKKDGDLGLFREKIGGAFDAIIGRGLPAKKQIDYDPTHKVQKEGYLEIAGLVRNTDFGEEVPMLFLYPDRWNGRVVIWLSEQGKAGILKANGEPIDPVAELIRTGASVVGVDLLYQGEFLAGDAPEQSRRVGNPRDFTGYTLGYNRALFAHRVRDVLTTIAFCRNHELEPKRVDLVGLKGAGHWAAAARAQARDAVDSAAIDTVGFRFSKLTDWRDPDFLPAAAKYFDLPGMIALSAPSPLWLSEPAKTAPYPVAEVYAAADAESNLTYYRGDDQTGVAVQWLLKQK